MAQKRQEERARKAELNRLDNEDCGDEEEEEEMTDESDDEEVRGCVSLLWINQFALSTFLLFCHPSSSLFQCVEDLLGGDDGEKEEEEEGSVAPSIRSPSPMALNGPSPTPDLVNTDGTLLLFPGSSCSRTGFVFVFGCYI